MSERAASKREADGSGRTNGEMIADDLVSSIARGPEKTRTEWAKTITATYRASVESIIKTGQLLIAAKEALRRGEWSKMFDNEEVPFSQNTAGQYMEIARNRVLSNSAFMQNLPASWGTLFEITKLPDEAIKEAIANGGIGPDTTRDEVKKMIEFARTSDVGNLANVRDALAVLLKFEQAHPDPAAISEPLWREMSTDWHRYFNTHGVKRVADWLSRLHAALPSNDNQEAHLWAMRKRKGTRGYRFRPLRPRPTPRTLRLPAQDYVEVDECDAEA